MPPRNNTEKIINEFNLKGKEFGLKNAEILSYQNLKDSSVLMYNLNDEKFIKSAQSWRVFFSKLSKLKAANEKLAIEKAQKTICEQRAEKAKNKVLEKAKKRNHQIINFKYNNYVKNCTFTVYCLVHKKTYKKIYFLNYVHPKIKFGINCCACSLKSRLKKF